MIDYVLSSFARARMPGGLIGLFALLALLWVHPAVAQTVPPPAPAQLTPEQWRADLAFVAAEIEARHPNAFHTVSREEFRAAVASLHARIPRLGRNQIIVEMMRIAAMVGDGHTRIDPRKDARFGFPSLPVALYLFEDGLYVRAAAPAQAALVGARIEAIGGVPIDEAIRRIAQIASRDNEIGTRLFVPLYLAMPDILHALGLSDRRDAATLRLSRGGRSWSETVPAGAVAPSWPPDTDISLVTPAGWVDAHAAAPPPLWLRAPLEYHRLIELPEQRALYVQLNMVANVEGQSLEAFARRIEARAAQLNPERLILDLRLNQGGNGDLRGPLIRALIRAEDDDTRLLVLTWRGTFSASQFLLDDLDRLTSAVVIGEPAGSRPSHYGDAYRSVMPNSGITLRTSIMYWQEGQNFAPWTWVDLSVPYRFSDYAAGRDPVLEAALAYQPPASLQDRLLAAFREGGENRLGEVIDGYRAERANRHANLAAQLSLAARRLWGQERQAALVIAALTARHYPRSLEAVLTHALLADAAGQAEAARQAATRAVELDRNNRTARSLLERLGAAPSS